MGDFIQHEPCPECGSKDNVAVYTDGKYCFGCGWVESIDKVLYFKNQAGLRQESKDKNKLLTKSYPADASSYMPTKALEWLGKYGLTQHDATKHGMLWSAACNYLIFPVRDNVGNLLMWQARTFNPGEPKYITQGNKESCDYILGESALVKSKTLVLVEDLLSAIKVSKVTPAMPLWGVTFSKQRAIRLVRTYPNIVLWLDKDKVDASVMITRTYSLMFKRFSVLSTERDPKELTLEEITDQLMTRMNPEELDFV